MDIRLDFFERRETHYLRSCEHFAEYAYPQELIESMLIQAGFKSVEVFDDCTFTPSSAVSQRILFAAKK